MKKKIFLLTLLLICVVGISYAQQKVYSHPFQQNDSTWNKFSNAQERINALQIPQDKLEQIPTCDLLDLCLTFPYLSDILLYDEQEKGYNALTKEYNGFQEFLKRDDCVDVLLDKYASIMSDTLSQEGISKAEKGFRSVQYYTVIQMLKMKYASEEMNNFQVEQMFALTKKLYKALNTKQLFVGNLTANAILQINTFITRVVYYSDFNYVNRYTPNGSTVTAGILKIDDYDANEKANIINDVLINYGVTILSEPTKTYNCHGYAWHMVEAHENDPVWIDEEEIYWEDGSYTEVPESYATKVAYEGNHSAVRISSTLYHSKWGDWPLVAHSPNNVPSGYLPEQPKRYFVRFSISGPTIPGTASTYYVPNLPNGWTVDWSMGNELVLPSYFTENSPETNQLRINNSAKNHIKGNLIAKIYNNNNTLVKTLTKYINTADGFTATYSQTKTPNFTQISGTLTDEGTIIDAGQGSVLSIVSSDFNNATFSFVTRNHMPLIPNPLEVNATNLLDAPNPTYTLNGNTLGLTFPINSSDLECDVKCVNGNKVICFTVWAFTPFAGGLTPFTMMLSSNDDALGVSIVENEENEQSTYGIRNQNVAEEWAVTIYNAQTNRIAYKGKINDGKLNIDTNGWTSGIYIVQAKSGNYILTEKVKL